MFQSRSKRSQRDPEGDLAGGDCSRHKRGYQIPEASMSLVCLTASNKADYLCECLLFFVFKLDFRLRGQ